MQSWPEPKHYLKNDKIDNPYIRSPPPLIFDQIPKQKAPPPISTAIPPSHVGTSHIGKSHKLQNSKPGG